jgi:hypothetical protein
VTEEDPTEEGGTDELTTGAGEGPPQAASKAATSTSTGPVAFALAHTLNPFRSH